MAGVSYTGVSTGGAARPASADSRPLDRWPKNGVDTIIGGSCRLSELVSNSMRLITAMDEWRRRPSETSSIQSPTASFAAAQVGQMCRSSNSSFKVAQRDSAAALSLYTPVPDRSDQIALAGEAGPLLAGVLTVAVSVQDDILAC
jgi:hypothetical protein